MYHKRYLDEVFINYNTTYVQSTYDISLDPSYLGFFCLFWWLVAKKRYKSQERHINVNDYAYISQENYKITLIRLTFPPFTLFKLFLIYQNRIKQYTGKWTWKVIEQSIIYRIIVWYSFMNQIQTKILCLINC